MADPERVEYHSLINIKPRQGHRSMEVKDPGVREKVVEVVDHWVEW